MLRKRKLIVDEVKAITGEEMKAQLSDISEIVTTVGMNSNFICLIALILLVCQRRRSS
jgi:hypothetical protein